MKVHGLLKIEILQKDVCHAFMCGGEYVDCSLCPTAPARTHSRTQRYTQTRTPMYTRTHARTYALMGTCAYARTYTNRHMHVH